MKDRTFRPALEQLDARVLPAISFTNGLLKVTGTIGNDVIRVTTPNATQIRVFITTTREVRLVNALAVNSIDIRSLDGNDTVIISPTVTQSAFVSAGRGFDNVLGGSGDDDLFGGRGRDLISGGPGDDAIDGGLGDDLADGSVGIDTVLNAIDVELELTVNATGAGGATGTASFEVGGDQFERIFTFTFDGIPTGGGIAEVFIDGISLGQFPVDIDQTSGGGNFTIDLDPDGDGVIGYPIGFPEVHDGSVLAVELNGVLVLQGTFTAI